MDPFTMKTFPRYRPLVRASLRPIVLISLFLLMLLFTLGARDVSPQVDIISPLLSTSRTQYSSDTPADKEDVKFCDLPGNCIFDIGHNTGQDTAFYLRDPNNRVVAVEANPALVAISEKKFAKEIEEGRLKLLTIALTHEGQARETVKFWVNKFDKFSSFLERRGCRNDHGQEVEPGDHTWCESVDIESKTCRDLVEEYGTPVYLKVDIEGMDAVCIESVGELDITKRPKYLSTESVNEARLERLEDMGYVDFKAVNQRRLHFDVEPELRGYSGPWGENAVDDDTGTEWTRREKMIQRLPLARKMMVDDVERPVWYDIHARMGDLPSGESM